MLLFFKTGATDDGLQDCSGLEAYPFQYVAQAPNFSMTYPPGIGATIPTSIGFRMNMHYLNTGPTPIHGQDRITMYVAKSGVVTQHAGTIFYSQATIQIPATDKPYTSTTSCNVSQDVNLLSADSHMHRRATDFVATANGQTLYQTTAWSDPVLSVYSPPIHLSSGTPITWSCTYVNETASPLTFGESAANERHVHLSGNLLSRRRREQSDPQLRGVKVGRRTPDLPGERPARRARRTGPA